MEIEINYLAVLLAGLSTMLVGFVWYTPKVFGNTWMALTKVKMDRKMSQKDTAVLYGGALLTSLITAFVLAHVAFLAHHFYGGSFLSHALSTGFWLWLGFTATGLYSHDSFEGRSPKLTALNAAHELAAIMVMALIIGLIGTY